MKIAIARGEEGIEVALFRLNAIGQGAIEGEMMIMIGLERNTGTMTGTDMIAVSTIHQERIVEKEIGDTLGGDVIGRTQSRDPVAVRHAVTEVGTEVLTVTAVEVLAADLIDMIPLVLVLVHQKLANLGHQSIRMIRHPIRHAIHVSKLGFEITEYRLLLKYPRSRQAMNQIPLKTLSGLFLPGKMKRPSAPGDEAPINPT